MSATAPREPVNFLSRLNDIQTQILLVYRAHKHLGKELTYYCLEKVFFFLLYAKNAVSVLSHCMLVLKCHVFKKHLSDPWAAHLVHQPSACTLAHGSLHSAQKSFQTWMWNIWAWDSNNRDGAFRKIGTLWQILVLFHKFCCKYMWVLTLERKQRWKKYLRLPVWAWKRKGNLSLTI